MLPVRYVEWGIANRFNDCIELNRNLLKYPDLHAAILRHEVEHTNKTFSWHDLRHDLLPTKKVSQVQLFKFMIKHPKAVSQFLPIYWSPSRKQLIFDLNLAVTYAISFGVIALGLWLLLW